MLVLERSRLWVGLNSRDWLALAKPRLSALVLMTCGVGVFLAPGSLPLWRRLVTMLATATIVGAANGLNSYLERHTDALMRRTRQRPLPGGRLDPKQALWVSLWVGLVSVGLLYKVANPLTALLAAAAYALYGFVYTPMKRHSWWAVWVGAIPGALPPLLGWTAVTDGLEVQGLSLFVLMFFWQLPHFFAIALYLHEDYARGGLKVLPLVHGHKTTQQAIGITAAILIPATLMPWWVGLAGTVYAGVALLCGLAFLVFAVMGFWRKYALRWARQIFLASVIHLSVLLITLLMGA